MKRAKYLILSIIGLAIVVAIPSYGATAVLLCGLITVTTFFLIRRYDTDEDTRSFLSQIFFYGLILRVFVAVLTFVFELQGFFQPDSDAYDTIGVYLSGHWSSYLFGSFTDSPANLEALAFISNNFGICYVVGGIYLLVGRNMLAVQMIFSALGACAAPLIYLCVISIFQNKAAARTAGVLVAIFPSLVLWSAQGTKDGLMIFLLALTLMLALKLQRRFEVKTFVILLASIACVYAIRPYIFFMVAVSVIGGFVIGIKTPIKVTIGRLCVIAFLGLLLSLGGLSNGMQDYLENEANFETLSRHRSYLTTAAASSFGKDWDVSSPEKALAILPIGFAYLMLSPFPWQMENLRSTLPLPEMIIWWLALPYLVIGIFYTIRYKLRNAISPLLFLFLLSIFYSIFQGNAGTSFRQRAQLQVFLLMFIAVGWHFLKEKREDARLMRAASLQRVALARNQFQTNYSKSR